MPYNKYPLPAARTLDSASFPLDYTRGSNFLQTSERVLTKRWRGRVDILTSLAHGAEATLALTATCSDLSFALGS